METRRKAFAYVTRGQELLIFSHPLHPEAGLQVPAGSIEEGETPKEGVLREAFEETGIDGLEIVSFLGEQVREMRDLGVEAYHHRYFYHLTTTGKTPERWRHFEVAPADDPDAERIPFDFFWTPLDAVPSLIAEHDRFVALLRSRLSGTDAGGPRST